MIVFMNEADMRVRGIAEGDMVELESLADDKRRVVGGFWVKAHSRRSCEAHTEREAHTLLLT
jgi:anaerobic selenocysteine-containing dehydrogenase